MMVLIMSRAPEVLLTSTSANLSLRDKDGNTALHLACSNVSLQPPSYLFIYCLGFQGLCGFKNQQVGMDVFASAL